MEPKLEKAMKCMMLTNSASDGEALSAVRRANEILKSANKTWENIFKSAPQQQQRQQPPPRRDFDPGEIVMQFGKHKGRSLYDIFEEHPGYVYWLSENISDLNLRSKIEQFLEENE